MLKGNTRENENSGTVGGGGKEGKEVMFEDYKRSQEAQINYTPLPLLPWEGQ